MCHDNAQIRLAPSILSADFSRLGEEIRTVEQAGAHLIHVDVMDGHFVPNLTLGPPLVASIRKTTQLPLDVHLMVENPDLLIPAFAEAGADWISVHVEACRHLDRTLQLIRSCSLRAGVVLNPATPITALEEVLRLVDTVLIMSVNPGFGGQEFIPYSLEKIKRLRKIIQHKGLSVRIEVDGGVNLENVGDLVRSGAEILVVGSQIFSFQDPSQRVKSFLEAFTAAMDGDRAEAPGRSA
ncbi:MAG: ribulose-phosphate 3-epimerase [Acidobacteriota bacterium]